MFESGSSQFTSEVYQNAPNVSMMFTMFTPTFGNGDFVIQPTNPGELGQGFPTIPYLPLEALIYQQQSSNPNVSPVNTMAGSNTGQQVIQSTQSTNDTTGTPRSLMGNQQTQ